MTLPAKRDTMRALNVLLLGLICVSFATGWIASWLALTEFGLHKWSSIAFVVVAAAHLAVHWRRLVTRWLSRQLGRRDVVAPLRVAELPLHSTLEEAA
jgi:apolipoprotein N-acyltransferase